MLERDAAMKKPVGVEAGLLEGAGVLRERPRTDNGLVVVVVLVRVLGKVGVLALERAGAGVGVPVGVEAGLLDGTGVLRECARTDDDRLVGVVILVPV